MKIEPGTFIPQDIRATYLRGEALSIKELPTHVPMGLIHDVVVKRKVEAGQMVSFDDVDIPDSKTYDAWKFTLNLVN